MSFSQNDEEDYILQIVGSDIGRFLDIGAWNPNIFSNTRELFLRGWSGVVIEPSPGPFLDLLTEYGKCNRIQLVCAAVGWEREIVRFYMTEDAVSTAVEQHYQKWRDRCQYEGAFFTVMLPLLDVLNKFGRDFQFVNIDTEGTSADLFLHALQIGLFPKCFCVEHDARHKEIEDAAAACGYAVVLTNGENKIFRKV